MSRIPAKGELLFKEESYAIVGAAMEVHSCLGSGFLEAVHADALALELGTRGVPFEREVPIDVRYKGALLPHRYRADFLAFGAILLELKAVRSLGDAERAQTINYLKAIQLPLALLMNFGAPQLEWMRLANTR